MTDSATALIYAKNISKSYQVGKKNTQILTDISLRIDENELVFLNGPSGAGKTTLMYILAGLEPPDKGEVLLQNKNYYHYSLAKQAKLRRHNIAYIFQNYYLFPEFTVLENILINPLLQGKNKKAKAMELLELVGLATRCHHLPSELSGGEQQRVAIARALISKPKIIFADEPTGNLDSKNCDIITELLFKLSREKQCTLVVVTHNSAIIPKNCRIITIKDGRIK